MTKINKPKCVWHDCRRTATHQAVGNPAYVVCKAHADRWDALISQETAALNERIEQQNAARWLRGVC